MTKKRSVLYLAVGFVLFLMSSGFLGMCVGPDYKPATIEITDPVKGTVFDSGTPAIVISGKVKAGDSAVQSLKAQGKTIAFNSSTGAFSYQFTLDQSRIYSTCEFTVIDKKGITNIERVSYALGQSSEPGALGVIDNALRIVMTDSLLDQVELFANRFMNMWKNDLIYGWDSTPYGSHNPDSPFSGMAPLLPIRANVPDGMNGWITINPTMGGNDKGYINIGGIQLSTDIQSNNQITASMNILREAWVNPTGGSSKSIFVQGHYRTYPLGIETRIHFTFKAEGMSVSNIKLGLGVNSSNKIVAKLDMRNANINFVDPKLEFGFITIEDWLMDWILDIVKDLVLSSLAFEMELVSINDLAFEAAGLSLSGWPMASTIFTTPNDSQMVIDLGLSAKLAEGTVPAVPKLTKFLSTLPNAQPNIVMTSSENIAMAISDDLMNEASFDLIQLGILNGIDLSSVVKDLLGKLADGRTIIAKATLVTPPVFDFSGLHYPVLGDVTSDVGRFIIKDLYLDLYYKGSILPYPYAARMCVDVDLDLKLKLSADGTHVQALLDVPQSSFKINYLYTNLTNAALLPEIGGKLTVQVLDILLQKLVDFDIPTIDLYGQNIAVGIAGTELVDNCLVAKVNLAVQ